jgi:predicted DNA binding CopG/RHH family protein
MPKNKRLPEFKNYEEMGEFWDTHSLADYWDQTELAEFVISEQVRRRYVVRIDRDLLNRVQRVAQVRGVSTESLVNLLLEQRLSELR